MSQSRYILVHDLGTTGIKATLFDAAGATVATAFCLISSANGARIGIPWLVACLWGSRCRTAGPRWVAPFWKAWPSI